MRTGKYVIAYDISCNNERSRVSKILLGFGFRRQKSVFECVLSATDKKKLIEKLAKLKIETGFIKIYKQEYCFQSQTIGNAPENDPDKGHAFIVA
ncbi:MAG: CRISPR-associated endonuclease Cas2 [bacterium]